MKNITLKISALLLMMLSFSSFADQVIITGEPATLEMRDGTYYTPANYSVTTPYHYVTIDGTNRVCYAEKQPSLESLNMVTVNVNMNGKTMAWNCYEYSDTYFELK